MCVMQLHTGLQRTLQFRYAANFQSYGTMSRWEARLICGDLVS